LTPENKQLVMISSRLSEKDIFFYSFEVKQ